MPELFGLDIAQMIADSIQQAGGLRPVSIIREVPGQRDPNDSSAGLQTTQSTFMAQGFVEQTRRYADRVEINESANQVATIIGNSISPRTQPEVGDCLQIDGENYSIVEVRSDPARAVFECAVN